MAVWDSVVFVIVSLSIAAGTWQNVALKKPAWVSKVYTNGDLPASNAVDGVTTADPYRYTMHTEVNESTAWWKVDLQREVQSAQVTIYFRTDYKTRRNGVQLYTSVTNSSDAKEGHLCQGVTRRPDGTDIPDVLNVTCPGTWRYLTVYTETDNDGDGAMLDFAEVQVWTCPSAYYGTNCGQRCAARHCKSDPSCDMIQGQCVGGCTAGYQGTDCIQACPSGYYGTNCGQRCGARHCKSDSSCDMIQGQCVGGCTAGYQGTDCIQDCPAGFYGNNCFLRCTGRHCQSPSCLGDGACIIQCDAGWTLHDCTQECPNGTYGIKCNSACGHCADTNTCHHVTGACSGGCQAGWQLPLCQTELQMDSVITPTTAGIIGLAAGICFMLILVVGLYVGLVRKWRMQWINASQKDVVRVKDTQEPVDKNASQPSDNYTSLSEQAGGPNIYNNDYDAIDVEAKTNSDYDVIKNKA